MSKILGAGLALALAATSAQAVEVVGADLGLNYSQFTDSQVSALEKFQIDGSVELDFGSQFALQLDLSHAEFGYVKSGVTTFGLHSIFNYSDTGRLGLYVSHEAARNNNLYDFTSLGIEHYAKFDRFEVESYLGRSENERNAKVTHLGIWGKFDVTDQAKLGLRYDGLRVKDEDLDRLAITGDYQLSDTFALNAEIGKARFEYKSSQTYVGIGAKFTLGGKRNTTFNQRSVFNAFPGF